MTKMTRITTQWLKESWASPADIKRFQDMLGGDADWTRENLVRAAEAGLNLEWLARKLLTTDQKRIFKETMNEPEKRYQETMNEVLRTYQEAKSRVGQTYGEITDTARRTYNEAIAEALTALLGLE